MIAVATTAHFEVNLDIMLIDLVGQTFGRLTVICRAANDPRFGDRAAWRCRCVCGRATDVVGKSLRRGLTRSCGCLHDEVAAQRQRSHGLCGTREYQAWGAAKTRCFNPRQTQFKNYGGRGITMCDEWRSSFEVFLRDMGQCPAGCSIDRVDVNGPYAPGNCRWVPITVQANNTRANHRLTFNGETNTLSEWEQRLGFGRGVLSRRLSLGWSATKALTAPIRRWPGGHREPAVIEELEDRGGTDQGLRDEGRKQE